MNGTPAVLGILLIDDNAVWSPATVKQIEHSIPHSNRVVRWEAQLKAGLKALKEFHADSIWLDLDLPDSRPHETIARVPEIMACAPDATIIAFSDHFLKDPARDDLVLACIDAGVHRCATKSAREVECVINGLVFRAIRMARGKGHVTE